MNREKLIELLRILRDGTAQRKFVWEDLSDLEDGLFRTSIGGGLLRLGRAITPFQAPDGSREEDVEYGVWVVNGRQGVVNEQHFRRSDPDFSLVAELYGLAQFDARSGDEVIDQMLKSARERLAPA